MSVVRVPVSVVLVVFVVRVPVSVVRVVVDTAVAPQGIVVGVAVSGVAAVGSGVSAAAVGAAGPGTSAAAVAAVSAVVFGAVVAVAGAPDVSVPAPSPAPSLVPFLVAAVTAALAAAGWGSAVRVPSAARQQSSSQPARRYSSATQRLKCHRYHCYHL